MNKTIEEYLSQPQKEKVIYDCEDCGKHVERNGKKFKTNPHLKCKACYMISKYGVTTNIARPEVKAKRDETFLEKFNALTPSKDPEVKLKAKKTCLERYGVDNYFKTEHIKEISRNKDYSKIQEKIQDSNMKSYGVKTTLLVPEVQEKIKNTNLKKYGVEDYVLSDDYMAKSKKKYRYNGEVFDSSWELAYWIYCKDNDIDIHRNKTPHFRSDGKKIVFDFISNGRYLEIKGDYLTKMEDWPIRSEAYIKYDVKVLFKKDIEPILKYIYQKYGKEYLKKFKDKRPSDFKRKIIEVDRVKDINLFKNKNVKLHYKCFCCGRDVYTSYSTFNRFKDGLCKTCRKKKLTFLENSTNYSESGIQVEN